MSYMFTDREGFEWNKHCMTCDRYNMRGKPIGNPSTRQNTMTYCSAYDVYINEEPFKGYYDAGSRNNDCPEYYKSC